MGFLPFLAFAGMSDESLDQINHVGWFLPLLALVIPVTLILFLAFGKLIYVFLALVQGAAIFYGLKALVSHLRHQGFSSDQVRLMLAPCYLVACFGTNIVALIGVGVIRKFF